MEKVGTLMIRSSTIMGSGSMMKNMELVSIHLKEEYTMEAGLEINVKEKEVLNCKMGASLKARFKIINSFEDLLNTLMEMNTQDK